MQNMNEDRENMPAGRSSLGFSNSRSSGRNANSVAQNSKSGQKVSTPSIGLNPSSSRSRPSQEYGQEKGEVSLKFAMSNHDEVQDAINDNYVDAPPNSEIFTPGAGFPQSTKRSGNTSK